SSAGHRIEFAGFVNPEQLEQYLGSASIGINMLTAQSLNYKLSLGNKFFDYLHASIPAIHMNYPEYALLNKEFNVVELVEDYSTSSLVTAVQTLNNIEHYKRLQNNCINARHQLNWQKEEQVLLSLYHQINL
ncbi:MAG: hypothetical protein HKN09_07000, partial [Saprospiraceae bacterium]|nr:hypothetical protein [Saprospiraceae bacterium]